ncbi:MAG: hypothetical protein PVF77_09650 [Anaerolineae bacterium]|jgi:hypothetical protein
MRVAIQRINLPSLGKMGCLLGVVAAFLPSLLCGLLGVGLAGVVLEWLGGWQDLTISVLGQELASFDLVQFFGLEELLGYLEGLTAVSVWVFLLAALLMALLAGAVLAVVIMLVGIAYNLLAVATGGLVVEMDSVARQEQGPTTNNSARSP